MLPPELAERMRLDPVFFVRVLWPTVRLYKQQREILESVRDDDETFVPAGNALGKDFVGAICALWWFCTRRPARVVTTSVKEDQLVDVLWGEIRRFVATSRVKLPIVMGHLKIRQLCDDGSIHPNSELVGQVSNTQEGLLGRHSTGGFAPLEGGVKDIPRTLVVFDEASGVDDATYDSTQTWADRKLVIGNPWPCENFFRKGVDGGDVARDVVPVAAVGGDSGGAAPHHLGGPGYHRRVVRIEAEDSPNVRLARAEIAAGLAPSDRCLVPGVKGWAEYQRNLRLWDPQLICIGLRAQFYTGKELLLFPPDWLEHSWQLWRQLQGKRRVAKSMGIDPGEGGANSSWTVGDEYGVIAVISEKTPDTNIIPVKTREIGWSYGVPDDCWVFDRGGGGKQHADRMRADGWNVRTVAFGESLVDDPKHARNTVRDRIMAREEAYAYRNRRSEMYGELSLAVDPSRVPDKGGLRSGLVGFALPPRSFSEEATRLCHQLSKFPKVYDGEGRLDLPPKNKKDPKSKAKCLVDLIGHSPDEADSLVLMFHGMMHKVKRAVAGAVR